MARSVEDVVERRRKGPMEFAVGMVVICKRLNEYNCVIVSWESRYTKSDERTDESSNEDLPRKKQPKYQLHLENGDIGHAVEGEIKI